jgi:formamidopyrimidine-DNA glycosylase
MPELPEVECARRLAERHLAGRQILRVGVAPDPIVFAGVPPRRFAHVLGGRTVVGAGRKGKHLWLELDHRPWPVFHFGMTGSFHVYRRPAERPTYWKLELLMDNGVRLAMRNVRRLGRIRLLRDPENEPPICHLGWDPLRRMPPLPAFVDTVRRRSTSIKAVLLNQALIAGIGNWMADEVLYQSRIAPSRHCRSLTDQELRTLHRGIRRVVRLAVEADAEADRFPATWLFHCRWGKNPDARTAGGEAVRFDTVAGRTTAWVPARQA